MKLRIRAHWDKPVNLQPLVDEILDTIGEDLYNAAVESTPVRTGITSMSWHKARTSSNTEEITNDSYVGSYQVLSLLHEGTRPHRVGMFYWRAAGAFIRSGLKVRIDPDYIAVRAVPSKSGLPDAFEKGKKWQAIQFYSYKQDLTDAIEKGVDLSIRKLENSS